MNIRSGPASVVSAEPILFPLPLCLRPRLHGFVTVTVGAETTRLYPSNISIRIEKYSNVRSCVK